MGVLSFLFGRRGGSVPVVFPSNVNVVTYTPERVLFSEEDTRKIEGGPPEKVRALFNRWIAGNSTAVRRYKFQSYADQKGLYGSIWVQFTSGTKQYNYPNVPWIEFTAMIRASSRGVFVNNVLRRLYSVGRGRLRPSKPGATPHVGRARGKKAWK